MCTNCLPLRRGRCENCEDSHPQPAVSSIRNDIDTPSISEDESDSLSLDGSAAENTDASDCAEPVFVKITENTSFVWGDVDGNLFKPIMG